MGHEKPGRERAVRPDADAEVEAAWRDQVVECARDPRLLRAVFKGRERHRQVPWARVVLRPVLVRGRRQLQIAYYDRSRAVTRNLVGAQSDVELRSLASLAFKSFYVETRDRVLTVQISRRGRALVRIESRPGVPAASLEHDRERRRLVTPESSRDFLEVLGIATREGRIRPTRFSKYRQINEFLRLVDQIANLAALAAPVRIVDFGCGNAYLTFALYHYLNDVLRLPAELCGVDRNAELLERNAERSEVLGWSRVTFAASAILDFDPAARPAIVTALHACDTATDEALAQAVRWKTPLIFAAPCCHHDLQQRLSHSGSPAAFAPLLRHGILKDRLGTLLTDALRASLLRILGYTVQVIEFVSEEHTARNLMIRARRDAQSGRPQEIRDYVALKRTWDTTPHLEELLADELRGLL